MIITVSKTVLSQLIVLAALALAGCNETHSPAGHQPAASDIDAHASHESNEDHLAVPTAPSGERWATDEPLRASMTRLRSAIETQQTGEIDAADAQALASSVEKEVAFMIENCKLPPQPDQALHILIGRMMSSVAKLRKSPPDASAVVDLADVLHDYGRTFDHPGWAL